MAYEGYKYSFKNQFRTMASLTVYRTGRQQCTANYTRGLEVRDFYLIHYVIKGAGTYILNGVSYPVREGQAFLIYPNMPINYRADADDPWEFCWVGFNGTDARIMMNATAFTPQQPVITLRRPDQMLERMLEIYTARGNLPHEIISMTAHLYTLISFLIQENMGALAFQRRPGAARLRLYRRPLCLRHYRKGSGGSSGYLPQPTVPYFHADGFHVTPKISVGISHSSGLQSDEQTASFHQGGCLFGRL